MLQFVKRKYFLFSINGFKLICFSHSSLNGFELYNPKVPIFASICVEKMPQLTCLCSNVVSSYLKIFEESLENSSRFSNFEIERMNDKFPTDEINPKFERSMISPRDLKRLQVCEADVEYLHRIVNDEFSHFSAFIRASDERHSRPLYLLARPISGLETWGFPHRITKSHQSLCGSALMEISQNFSINVRVCSEYPQSFIDYREKDISKNFTQDSIKIFFIKGTYLGGIALDSEIREIRWCTKKEIEFLVPSDYFLAVNDMLF